MSIERLKAQSTLDQNLPTFELTCHCL